MSTKPPDIVLRLPGLTIRGFRGINDLTIPRLGRVTLLAGENGVGKSTVLDAIRLYAARGHFQAIRRILSNSEEIASVQDEDALVSIPDCQALFYGRQPNKDSRLSIATDKHGPALQIKPGPGLFRQHWPSYEDYPDAETTLLSVFFPGIKGILHKRFPPERNSSHRLNNMRYLSSPFAYRVDYDGEKRIPDIPCLALGPNVPSSSDIVNFWSKSALTPTETGALRALQLIYGDSVEQVAVVNEERAPHSRTDRRMLVRVKGLGDRVPLRSLGDGAVRMYGVALALASSQGGLLLLDEVENGIHYRRQPHFWKMVMQTAYENNVQVIATTHSWDCIVGFAQAAIQLEDVDGVLYRIDRFDDWMRAVEYNEEDLEVVAQQRIEIR